MAAEIRWKPGFMFMLPGDSGYVDTPGLIGVADSEIPQQKPDVRGPSGSYSGSGPPIQGPSASDIADYCYENDSRTSNG